MTMSADGFIAGKNDETPWSDDDWNAFQEFVKSCDVCLVGRRTYEIMRDDGDLEDSDPYIVVTKDKSFDTGKYEKIEIWSKAYLPNVEKVGVIGGAELNASMAELGLLDEMFIDIEPVILGQGIKLFGDHESKLKVELIGSKKIGSGTIQNHYRVIK